jgi:c(7)-type cytochrome triheme protein
VTTLRRWVGLTLVGLACASAGAAPPQLAFLRPVPQAPATAPSEPPRPAAVAENPARQALVRDDFYDPKNPDLVHLQRHDDALAGLPKDANGFPDWMRALNSGSIQPRTGLTPGAGITVFDLDVIMRNTKEMPHVRFPHAAHTMWLDCSNCHPQPFEPRAGSTRITMADIFRGKYCGMCHDRVAFVTFFSCHRCHSEPQTAPTATRP